MALLCLKRNAILLLLALCLTEIDIAVIRLPKLSNFTDFSPLEQYGMRYVSNVKELGKPDLIVLGGTKNTIADMKWLNETGLKSAIQKLAENGTDIFGICGG